MSKAIALAASVAMLLCTSVQAAQPSAQPERPWLDTSLSSEVRHRVRTEADPAQVAAVREALDYVANNLPLMVYGVVLAVAMLVAPFGLQGLLRRGWGLRLLSRPSGVRRSTEDA